ncbi:MAG: cytochrome B5 [Candidatus Bathyarchaeota archaeon]|jgi:predicted heme/steroid binding protein|nr:cytochrome B5 [Candidatus Bathyarchaeota archaeon]MDH5733873.1 cytochrome B5 [Candidatus Bathyarchaeota archaeon]
MKEFTEEELIQYNGKNGNPVYVVYKGKVYDVSTSFLWKDGTHQVLHTAGVDLTEALEQAPHGGDALEKFPVVGILRGSGVSNTPRKP